MSRIAFVIVALALFWSNNPSEAKELRMLGGFSEGFVFTTKIAKPFIELVKEESKGSLTVSYTGPDAVPTFEQFEPVQSGVFDLLFTHPAYHAGTTAVGLAIDAIASDPTNRRKAGIIDFIDKHYQTLGMKLISAPATGKKGFRFILKKPVTGRPGLKGRKIRGTVTYHPMIEELGGSGVVIGGGEVYSALQKGVIDGAAWGLVGVKDFKWYEVADYLSEPVFGQVGLMVFMNLDAWNALSAKDKSALQRAAVRLEMDTIALFDKLAAQEKKDLLALGMKTTTFSASEATQFDRMLSDGVWKIAEKKSPGPASELHKLAQKAGLSK